MPQNTSSYLSSITESGAFVWIESRHARDMLNTFVVVSSAEEYCYVLVIFKKNS